MPSRLKEMMLSEVGTHLKGVDNMIFVGYRGLTSLAIAEFRAELRKEQVHLRVVRNRISVKALSDIGEPGKVKGLFDGPTAVMDGEDPVAMAKVALAFAKRNDKLEVKGGIVEGQILTAKDVLALSTMPGKRDLQAGIVGLAMSPGSQLVAALGAPAGTLAGAIKALIEKLEKSPAAPEVTAAPQTSEGTAPAGAA
ncbi:MAG TPA: 50S ribosomal protein L10 [Planctomycetota bacterium]|nr:50S ribosomal protein L10 [Planctomycetota bacterium]